MEGCSSSLRHDLQNSISLFISCYLNKLRAQRHNMPPPLSSPRGRRRADAT